MDQQKIDYSDAAIIKHMKTCLKKSKIESQFALNTLKILSYNEVDRHRNLINRAHPIYRIYFYGTSLIVLSIAIMLGLLLLFMVNEQKTEVDPDANVIAFMQVALRKSEKQAWCALNTTKLMNYNECESIRALINPHSMIHKICLLGSIWSTLFIAFGIVLLFLFVIIKKIIKAVAWHPMTEHTNDYDIDLE